MDLVAVLLALICFLILLGTIELLGIVGAKLGLHAGFWGWVANVDLNALGYFIVGLFAFTWLLALAVWRLARLEDRWPAVTGSA